MAKASKKIVDGGGRPSKVASAAPLGVPGLLTPGSKLSGEPCGPGRTCQVLHTVIAETERHRPRAGGAGIEVAIGIGAKGAVERTIYRCGKGTRREPAALIVLNFCPFCGAKLGD